MSRKFIQLYLILPLLSLVYTTAWSQNAPESWQSETISAEIDTQLKKIKSGIEAADFKETAHWSKIISPNFTAHRKVTQTARSSQDMETFQIRYPQALWADPLSTDEKGLANWLHVLEQLTNGISNRSVKFKLFKIDSENTRPLVITHQYFHLAGVQQTQPMEHNATWEMHWELGSNNNWQLQHLSVQTLEVATYQKATANKDTLYSDVTEAIMADVVAYQTQLKLGTNYWLEQLENRFPSFYFGNHGIALGDINGDGLEDVYVCQPGGIPNRMLLHQPDHTVRDVSKQAGVDWLDYTRSALIVDLDNDGDGDLVVATLDALHLLENDGSGKFTAKTTIPQARGALSLSAADFDNDGLLDLYICKYFGQQDQEGTYALPLPYHDANNGGPNLLLRNLGKFSMEDVTEKTGISQNNHRFSFAAAWEDFDNDGDVDLYVANDFGRNNLYRNEAGRFEDVAAEFGVEDISAGMSVSWGDVNQDGWMDLYVSNMFSAAGNRITYQRKFLQKQSESDTVYFQRHARGNSLFINRAGKRFEDASESSGTTMGRWAWSSCITDINNDGKEDILVANGYITGRRLDDL